ncbi:MAG: O-antigen ligase family protein [Endozoicomonas sp.]
MKSRYLQGLFFGLLALFLWLPLPSGSKPVWASGLLSFLVYFLSIFLLLAIGLGKVKPTPALKQAQWFHVCFVVICCWVALQFIPLPSTWVQALSPQIWEIHANAASSLGNPLPEAMTFSLDVFATRLSFLLTLAYYLLFCLVLLLVDNRDRLNTFAWVIVISGTFQAVFGSLSTLSGMEVLLFVEKEFYRGVATGTFVNRNSFAGYLEMSLAIGVGLLIARLGNSGSSGWKEWFRQALETLMSNKVLLRSALAIMVIGLVMSRSRMGNTAFFSSLMLSGLLYVILRRQLTRGMMFLFASMIVIDIAIVSQWFGIDQVVERLEQTSMERESRPNVAAITLDMVREHSLTGTGGGTYYTALPAHHDGSWKGFYDLAHIDFLQFPLEFGVPAFLLMALMVLMAAWHATQAMRLRKDKLMAGMGFAAFMGILAIMIHSSVDFNLQIPANAALFVSLMAVALIARYMPVESRKRR